MGRDWRAPCPARYSLPFGNSGLDCSQEAGNLDLYVKSPGFQMFGLNSLRILQRPNSIPASWPHPGDLQLPSPALSPGRKH